MTHEQIVSLPSRFIHPGDQERKQQISFDLAELKTLQGIVIERIKRDDEEHNAAFLPHRQLAEKLEYFITNLEE